MSHSTRATFDIGALFSRSWEVFKENIGSLLGGMLVAGVVIWVANYAFMAGSLVLQGPFAVALCAMALKAVRGGRPEFVEVFSGFSLFLPAFLANLVYSIFAAIGFFLLVIPMFIVIIVYQPLFFLLTDRYREDWWGAMEASRTAVMENFGQWTLLFLIIFALNLAGSLLCGIGLIVTAPLSLVILALAYEQEFGAVVPPVPPVSDPTL